MATRFTIDADPFRGTEFTFIDQDKLTWAEADAIERVTGTTMGGIRHAAQQCVCGHTCDKHVKGACPSCSCEDVTPSTTTLSTTALFWVSVKRAMPTTTFGQITDTPMGAWGFVTDEPEPVVEPDPTPGDETLPV